MKRLAWIFGTMVLAGAACLALFWMLLPRDALKARLGQQIAAWTGRDVSLRGEPELDLFPRLTVTLKDVQVGGPEGMPDGAVISMERLQGGIRLLPLVIGRVEIASFRIIRPLIRLVRDESGARNWAFESGAAALQLAFAGDVPLGDFVVEDATIVYENRRRRVTEKLDSVNLSVEWPSVRQPLAFSGSGIWRGEQVTLSAAAEAPFEFLNGAATPIRARIDSAPITVDFSGEGGDVSSPELRGALVMSTPSLRAFARWLGNPAGPGSIPGPARLSGTATLHESSLSVADAQVALDGNAATGALRIGLGAIPDVTGTLALQTLDLNTYLDGIRGGLTGAGDWRGVALGSDWFRDLTADIRLSAGSVVAGPLRFGQTAASVSLRDGRLAVGIAQAAFQGGAVTGEVSMADFPEGAGGTLEAKLRANAFDLAGVAAALRLPDPMSGTASVSADLASAGPNLGALITGLTGTGRIEVQNGSVPLFGIAELPVPPGTPPGPPSRVSPVDSVLAGLSFSGGTAILEQGKVAAPGFAADAKGWVVLADGSLGLNGTIQPTEAGSPAVPFTIDGTLARPAARPLALAN